MRSFCSPALHFLCQTPQAMKAFFSPPLLPTPKNHYSLFSPNPKILRTFARIPHTSGIFLELSQNTRVSATSNLHRERGQDAFLGMVGM